MDPLVLLLIVLFAAFTQSVAGFGLGLVAMPFIVEPLGVVPATSLIALVAFVTRIILIVVHREAVNLGVVRRLTLASLVALPIGVLFLQRLDSPLVLTLLGMVIAGYALYALLNLRLPEIAHPRWAYGVGFVAGLLSGAYNTGGPPVVMYATSRRWDPAEFKSNIHGFGLFNSLIVTGLHFYAQDYTPAVMHNFVLVLPVVLLGIGLGIYAARFINARLFRRMVLVMLVVVGLNLIF
jgi:uncharacterized protein